MFLSVDGTSTSAVATLPMQNVNTTGLENLAFVTQEAAVEVAPDCMPYNSGDELDGMSTVGKQDVESTTLVRPNFLNEPYK